MLQARLDIRGLESGITFQSYCRHLGNIRKRWRGRVHKDYLQHGDEARPQHISETEWKDITAFWDGQQQQRERHEADPTQPVNLVANNKYEVLEPCLILI